MVGTFRLSAKQSLDNGGRSPRRKIRCISIVLAALISFLGVQAELALAESDQVEAEPGLPRVSPGFYVDPERFEITPPGHVEPLDFLGLFAVDIGVGPDAVTDFDGGYDLTDARLAMGGRLEKGFGYFVQANLIQSTPILDLVLDWSGPNPDERSGFGSGLRIAAGYFRTPFSGEIQIGAPSLDFINRSQIVRAIAPGRQIGIQIDQKLAGDAAVLRVGAFNGNGFNTNDDERLLYMIRLDGTIACTCTCTCNGHDATETERLNGLTSPATETIWQYGLNVAYSEDDDAKLGLGLRDDFEGKRLLSGADLRWTRDNIFVSAEAIYGRIAPSGRGGGRDVYGYQGTIGWTITEMFQALLRYDALWAGSLASDRDLAIASLVITFSKYVSIQSELRLPVRGEPAKPGGIVNLTFQF